MKEITKTEAEGFFSDICTDRCGGICCDPWWGIVSYTLRKDDGLGRMSQFRDEVTASIRAREERIRGAYVTNEEPSRALFNAPIRYNASVEKIAVEGKTILLTLRVMFAFRCLFLSAGKHCGIHPAVTGGGDIRPPHCGYMGTLDAKEGEKGFCRIIDSAKSSAVSSN